MSISDLFERDPTRRLQAVQKINATQRAETDVSEFYETESAERVLTQLGDCVRRHPKEAARFCYIHATFGSGKTHLLRLVGLLVDTEAELAHLGDRLADQWPGFDALRRSISASHVDRLKPVFLNALDRDISNAPPLPFVIFEAIGRELGYPTEPNWLLVWAWRLDMEYDGIWDGLQEIKHEGKTFDEVLAERASLRSWLYEALPAMPETAGTEFDTPGGVKASIEAAEAADPEAFGPSDLAERVETATSALTQGSRQVELLLGLDEVALFVGDSSQRCREFERTMEALQRGPNPVVVATGQFSLPATRGRLIGEPPEEHWIRTQVSLEGADTESIVRKRWLQKSTAGRKRLKPLVGPVADLSVENDRAARSSNPDPIESYPFRACDLSLLRTVIQQLIADDPSVDSEAIEARTLLVLVRSLFTTFDWASNPAGMLVAWDVLFDLLAEETAYLPSWVQGMIDNTLIPTFGSETAWEVRLAKALFLLNQLPTVRSTSTNLGRLLVDDLTTAVDAVVERTEAGLTALVDNQMVLAQTTDHGETVYTLVSAKQKRILSRARDEAATIARHQLSAWLETQLRETDELLSPADSRHLVDVGDERQVPLRYAYSILESVDRAPTPEYDAVRIRMLAADGETVSEQVERWQAVNTDRDGGEHALIAIEIPEAVVEQIRAVIGLGRVLESETEVHAELETSYRTDKRRLESSIDEMATSAAVYTTHDHRGRRSTVLSAVIEDQVDAVFGSTRKTLSRPLVAVDDATAMAAFFRGCDVWPLSDADAEMLGVDTTAAEVGDTGWCRAFIERYESAKSVDVETLLQQTWTASGEYRGTPPESIAALVVTLASSTEPVALKQDTEYVSDPAAIGRQLQTEDGLTSLQVRFESELIDAKTIRSLVRTVVSSELQGDGPDEWLGELSRWIDANSLSVKRTLKRAHRAFDVTLDRFAATIDPALTGGELSPSDLECGDGPETVLLEAAAFANARRLFAATDGETLWEQFSNEFETMSSLYPDASVTADMRTTAADDTVPSVSTVNSQLRDARAYRLEKTTAQYRRLTGEPVAVSDPDAACKALVEWLQANEDSIRQQVETATATFDDVTLDAINALLAAVRNGDHISAVDLIEPAMVRDAETVETVRSLFAGEESCWTQLQRAGEQLRADHPHSPTTDAVETVLTAGRPPTEQCVRRLLERAHDPMPSGSDIETWGELQCLADRLCVELPNAEVTDEVTAAVDGDDRPSEARIAELLEKAQTVLDRNRAVIDALDALDTDDIVLIET